MSIKCRAYYAIGQLALTNSKHPDRFSQYVPSHITHGHGPYLYDVDGNEWLDYIGGLGTNHFGYANELIVKDQLEHVYEGECHSLPTVYEVYAAEALKSMFPWAERVKWVNDGSSACTAAIAMARVYTGRSKVLYTGYHGWHPEEISQVAIHPDGNVYNYRQMQHITQIDESIAAVIIEPVELDNSRERIEWLKKLRQRCDANGAVLIYDEVITGVRYPGFGVCNNYGVRPDLVLLGKALGNGAKIAAVAGKKEILNSDYFVSGTYHGHIPSLVSVISCIKHAKNQVRFDLEKLNEDSLWFYSELNALAKDLFWIEGWGCRGAFKGDYHLYFQEMAKAKILFCPSIFMNFANIKHTEKVLEATKLVMKRIRSGKVIYEGQKPTPAIANKQRT